MEGKEDNQTHDSGKFHLLSPPPLPLTAAEGTAAGTVVGTVAGTVGGMIRGADGLKKKRGRPRMYGPDGKPPGTLSPMPISASIPLTGDYSGWKDSQVKPVVTSIKRKQSLEFCTPGEHVAFSSGNNFTPHVLTVNTGEDVNMKIMSFAQQGSKAICVLTANGAISNVTLRQPNSSGGTLTYEGRFDILSLSGAFVSNDSGAAKGISGGMSVSLAGPDGRVLGGGLAGMLLAASPIQIILGSFLPGQEVEPPNPKKPRFEPIPTISPPIIAATPVFKEATSDEPNIKFTLTSPTNVSQGLAPENNRSLHGSEPVFRVSC